MFTNDDFNEIMRNLGKSTVSETFLENLTPRISYRISTEPENLGKDASELTPSYKRPFELGANRPSNFSKIKEKPQFLPDKSESPRKTLLKRRGSASLLASCENPLDFCENQPSPFEKQLEKLKKTVENQEKLAIPLENPVKNNDLLKVLQVFLLLAVEVERLDAENRTWRVLYAEMEEKLARISHETAETTANLQQNLKSEVKAIVQQFNEEKQAWEQDLRGLRQKLDRKNKDIEILLQKNEKLQQFSQEIEKNKEIAKLNAGENGKNAEKSKFFEELEQWKQRNCVLEMKLQEMKLIENRLFDYEGKFAMLMQENATLKNKNFVFAKDLDNLAGNLAKKIEENDFLKQKCNKLEMLVTEMRLELAKMQKNAKK